jgi:Alr-MurF fusion protein
MKYNLLSSDVAEIVGGRLVGPGDLPVYDIVTDSRQVIYSEGLIFFALSGKNHNGHKYIQVLYNNGVRVFVTETDLSEYSVYPEAAFIITSSSVGALQALATWRRKSVATCVIAVTGSTGKTIVKEWLADLAGRYAPVVRSPKSYNSQIGVPLSVWKLNDKYRYGIFEAGISQPGEMEKLQRIIDPEVGIITNIGDAHRENFPDDRTKVIEKLKLFRNARVIVYCRDQELVREAISGDPAFGNKLLVDWSVRDPEATVYVTFSAGSGKGRGLRIKFRGRTLDYSIPFSDRASVENAITVASTALALDLPDYVIEEGLGRLVSVAMRMELKSGVNNCQLIEDYYNSDPGSLGMAIDYLKTQAGRKHALILSDFVQSGRDEKELYSEVAALVERAGISRFIGVGQALVRNASLFSPDAMFFSSTDDLLRVFTNSVFRDEVILLKGARIFEFERIAILLEQQIHQTVLEVSLDAIAHNLGEFRKLLKTETRMMGMVKAFAYGAGPAEIASLLEYHRVSYLAVAYGDEGVELRNAGVTLPVMVMNPDPSSLDLLIKYNLEPEIYSFDSFFYFAQAAARHGLLGYPVHIKIDTGMHRLGFMPDEIDKLAGLLRTEDRMKVASVFSHLAASENTALDDFTRKQVDRFIRAAGQISDAVGYTFIRHILNSSGIARMPQYQFEMVRPGIGIYGIGNFEGLNLRPAGRFKTRVSQVKWIPAGEPVGYGCADVADADRMIAIVAAGYADGLSRRLGNRNGSVWIRDSRALLIGNICMDMCMADVTGLNVIPGDEAEIFGDHIPIDELALRCGTIPYEILTSIPVRVKRIFYRE